MLFIIDITLYFKILISFPFFVTKCHNSPYPSPSHISHHTTLHNNIPAEYLGTGVFSYICQPNVLLNSV